MSLPASGPIDINAISSEIWGGDISGNTIARRNLSGLASMLSYSAPYSFSSFYGLTGDAILTRYGSITTTTSSSTAYVAYRPLIRSGYISTNGTTLRMYVQISVSSLPSGGLTWYYGYNSTSTWYTIVSTSSTMSPTNYLLAPILDYNDILYIRVATSHSVGSYPNTSCRIYGMSLQHGAAASWTRTEPYIWTVTL